MLTNINLEEQVLAAMLSDKDCIDEGMALLKDHHFGDKFNQLVFGRIRSMYEQDKFIDATTVYSELGELAKGRGTAWMILKDAFFSKGTFGYSVAGLEDARKKRVAVTMAQEIIKRAENGEEIASILQDAEATLYALEANEEATAIVTPQEQAASMLDTLAARMDKKSNGGIKTTYIRLNYATNGGFLPGQLIIFASKTGKGKTALAMNLMRDVSIIQKQPALYINTEMGKEQLDCRWMAILTDDEAITHSKIASGLLEEKEFNTVVGNIDRMHNSGFYSVTMPSLTISSLISTARRFKAKTKLKVLVVDYVGRMETTDGKLQEWQVFKTIAKRLKTLAQELDVAVIMLAQLSDEEKLEGAKAMKNEADLFGILREMTTEEMAKFMGYNYFLVLDKNRDGKRIKIPLEFIGEKLTFRGETMDEISGRK